MSKKEWTLEELEEFVGREQLTKLFIEHYLMLVGNTQSSGVDTDGTKLDDIME